MWHERQTGRNKMTTQNNNIAPATVVRQLSTNQLAQILQASQAHKDLLRRQEEDRRRDSDRRRNLKENREGYHAGFGIMLSAFEAVARHDADETKSKAK